MNYPVPENHSKSNLLPGEEEGRRAGSLCVAGGNCKCLTQYSQQTLCAGLLPLAASLQQGVLGSFWVGLFWFMAVHKPWAGRGCSHTPTASVVLHKTGTIITLGSTVDKEPGFHRAFIYKYLQVSSPLDLKIEARP